MTDTKIWRLLIIWSKTGCSYVARGSLRCLVNVLSRVFIRTLPDLAYVYKSKEALLASYMYTPDVHEGHTYNLDQWLPWVLLLMYMVVPQHQSTARLDKNCHPDTIMCTSTLYSIALVNPPLK